MRLKMTGSFKKYTALSLLIPAVLLCAPLTLLAMDKETGQQKQGPLRPVRQTAASAAREAASAKRAGREPDSSASASGKSRTPASVAGKGREAITTSRDLTVHELQLALEEAEAALREKETAVAQIRQKLAAAMAKETASVQGKDNTSNRSVAQGFCEKAKAAALTAAGNTKVPFNKDTYFSLMEKLEGISSAFTSRLSSFSQMEHYGVSTDDFFLKKASDADTRDCYSALEYIIEIDGMFKSLNIPTPEIVGWLKALTQLEHYQGKFNYLLYPHVNWVIRGVLKDFKEKQKSIPYSLLR